MQQGRLADVHSIYYLPGFLDYDIVGPDVAVAVS